MIRSMTGFGRGQADYAAFAARAEVRSVNNKTLRVTCRVPEGFQGLEVELEKVVRDHLDRGAVTVTVTCEDLSGQMGYYVDDVLIAQYATALRTAQQRFGLAGEVTIGQIAALPGVVRRRETTGDLPEEIVAVLRNAVAAAMDDLLRARAAEGAFIWKDILARSEHVAAMVDAVEARIPAILERYRTRVRERLAPLLQDLHAAVNEDDLHKEVVYYADRSDITEEITRLRSHVQMLRTLGDGDTPCGRKLEFITQEMFREANTLGSKAGDASMLPEVLEIKSEIEKIREQALNVE